MMNTKYAHLLAKRTVVSLCALLLLSLNGCAQHEVQTSGGTETVVQNNRTVHAGRVNEKAETPTTIDRQLDYATLNPVPVHFEKMSIKLDDANKQLLAKLGERGKKAKSVIITAYCDKTQVGNAKAAAIARGNAVKTELIQLGVKAKVIRIKYVTDASGKHMAELQFS